MADSEAPKPKKSTPKPSHPKYIEMVSTAIESLKERGGSSRLAILKFITGKFKVSENPKVVNSQLKLALKKGVESGTLSQTKGTGASGSFKLAKKPAAPKKVAKKPAKKVTPKAAKSPKKVKAKKPAKSPKKAAKSPKKPKAAKSTKKAKSPKKVTKPKKTAATKPAKKDAKPKTKKAAAKKPAKK